MDRIVDLDGWRREHEPEELRLERAVLELDACFEGKERSEVPEWAITEVFAIQGCISMDLLDEAAERAERLVRRWRRHDRQRRRSG